MVHIVNFLIPRLVQNVHGRDGSIHRETGKKDWAFGR